MRATNHHQPISIHTANESKAEARRLKDKIMSGYPLNSHENKSLDAITDAMDRTVEAQEENRKSTREERIDENETKLSKNLPQGVYLAALEILQGEEFYLIVKKLIPVAIVNHEQGTHAIGIAMSEALIMAIEEEAKAMADNEP